MNRRPWNSFFFFFGKNDNPVTGSSKETIGYFFYPVGSNLCAITADGYSDLKSIGLSERINCSNSRKSPKPAVCRRPADRCIARLQITNIVHDGVDLRSWIKQAIRDASLSDYGTIRKVLS